MTSGPRRIPQKRAQKDWEVNPQNYAWEIQPVLDKHGNVRVKKNGEPMAKRVRKKIHPSASENDQEHPAKRTREVECASNSIAENNSESQSVAVAEGTTM